MDQDILRKFEEQEKKLDNIYASVEKTRKYFLWTLIIGVVSFLLPIIGLIVIIPWFLSVLSSSYSLN